MEILFLGTSGSGITSRRNLPSQIIDRRILLDCGEGTVKSLYEHNIPLKSIKAIIFSHLHADHFLGIVSLLWQMAFYDPLPDPPPIYVPEGMKPHFENIVKNSFCPFERANFSFNIYELPIIHNQPLKLEIDGTSYIIDWMKTLHIPLCYAYKINRNIVFSGDTVYFEDLAPFIKGSKILIHEATFSDDYEDIAKKSNHCVPKQAAEIALQAGIEDLYLYHVPDVKEEDEKNFLTNAKKIFPNIKVARDSMILKI